MRERARHERGAHYTDAAAILEHVVRPSLVEPWRARLREAKTPGERLALHAALTATRVLDPACGCGNFLHVAYEALRSLERAMLGEAPPRARRVSVLQLFGIDRGPVRRRARPPHAHPRGGDGAAPGGPRRQRAL